jgi:thiol-disulfide isomerase/thioredoxin
MVIQQPNDEELDQILSRMMKNMVMQSRSSGQSCCRYSDKVKGMVSIKSYEEFINVISLCRLAFVLITSTYCPYCYIFKPIFAKVAKIYEGKAAFVEVNADILPEIAWLYNVYSTPTTIVLYNERPIDVIVGHLPFDIFNRYVLEVLNRAGCINT